MAAPPPVPEWFGQSPHGEPPPGRSRSGLVTAAAMLAVIGAGAGVFVARSSRDRTTVAAASPSASDDAEHERLARKVAELERTVAQLRATADGGTEAGAVAPGDPLAPAATGGEPDRTALLAVIRAVQGPAKKCFEQGLQKDPASSGRIQTHIVVAPDGHVSRTDATSSGHLAPEVVACVKAAVSRARFPASGSETSLSVPFVFTSAE